MSNEIASAPNQYPLLPLRDVVVFPHMVIPLFVGRPKSIKAMEIAMEAGKSILLVAQKSAAKDEPTAEDLYKIGCISNILQMLKLPDGTVKVLVEGSQRARIQSIDDMRSHYVSEATAVPADAGDVTEIEAMRRALIAQFDQYVKLNKKIPPEILTSLAGIEEAGRLADTIAAHLPLKLEQKQQVLEMFEVKARLEHLLSQLETEIDILQVEKRIRGRVKRQMEKSQREYYLNEQVKAIQKELGEGAHRRIPRGADSCGQGQGADPVPGGRARGGKNFSRTVDRAGDQSQIRAHVAGGRARRGRDPRPPAHLYRLHARQDPPEHEQ